MGTNIHEKHLRDSGRSNPPSGPDKLGGGTHALRAGKDGPTQRKSVQPKDAAGDGPSQDDRLYRGRHSGRDGNPG
ncbi:MAG TPA: hypothetical protein VFE72_07280 [Lysobacter sp.]|nr:hypothetical protein [Lysobacter sp.]